MMIVVTGAAGRLGSVVCDALEDAGHMVVGTDRADPRGAKTRCLRELDLLDAGAVRQLMEETKPDLVVHLGNHPTWFEREPTMVYGENGRMNFNVFQAAVEVGVQRLIFASSVQVSGGERQTSTERSPLAYLPGDGDLPSIPGNAYALSKEAGEQQLRYFVAKDGVSAVALRFPWLRPESNPAAVPSYGRFDELFAWLSYRDAARLVVAISAVELPGYRAYFPANSLPLNGLSLAENVARYFAGVPVRGELSTLTALVDVSRITRETGWAPTPSTPSA